MGRIVDYTVLEPGDLILTSDAEPDWISRGIEHVQSQNMGGRDHARFTHAMMYLGAGFVLEATFEYKKPTAGIVESVRTIALMIGLEDIDNPAEPTAKDPGQKLNGVFVTPLWRYGSHYSLRARRPIRLVNNKGAQQEFVANALSLFAHDYNFEIIRQLAIETFIPSSAMPAEWSPKLGSAAVVCSTFYARAYDMTLLGEGLTAENGCCTPSFLSSNASFLDIPLHWSKIG